MAKKSALMGQPPISQSDALMRRGLVSIAPSQLNPNTSEPFGPLRPAGYEFETWAPSLRAGEGIAIFFFICVCTTARLYTRWFRTRYFGIDDWIIIPGALGAIVYLALDIVSGTKGCLGKHVYDCTYSEVYWYMLMAQLQQPIICFAVFAVKLSITFSNRRITNLISDRWNVVHGSFICLFLILLPLTVFLEAFQCLPVPARYSLIYIGSMADPRNIRCLNATAVGLSAHILHAATDVALLCVPITIILRSGISKRKKVRITAIFALGGMTTIASIMRNSNTTRGNINDMTWQYYDITWQYYDIYVWNTIDVCFAVVVASLPALDSLLDAGIERFKARTTCREPKVLASGTVELRNLVMHQQPLRTDRLAEPQFGHERKHGSTSPVSQTYGDT